MISSNLLTAKLLTKAEYSILLKLKFTGEAAHVPQSKGKQLWKYLEISEVIMIQQRGESRTPFHTGKSSLYDEELSSSISL